MVNRRNVWTAGVSAAGIVVSRMRWEVDQVGVAVVAGIFLAAFIAKTGCGWGGGITKHRSIPCEYNFYSIVTTSVPGRYAVFQVA
jgi:hypothetical protein